MTGLIFDSKNTILPPVRPDCELVWAMLSVMYITEGGGKVAFYAYVLGR